MSQTTKGVKMGFNISIDGDQYLSVDAIWPDGNAPENPTAEDVRDLILESGSLSRWLSDWNMDYGMRVHVEGVEVPF